MKYYIGHENVYRKLQAAGKVSWGDRQGGHGALAEGANIRQLIDTAFSSIPFATPPKDALDLGCGGGDASFHLARYNLRTLGVDVAPTAIALAQQEAARRKLSSAQFQLLDIVNHPNPIPCFDLVVDAACLHCIVFDDDRAQALANIRKVLRHDGHFLVNTKTTTGNTHAPDPNSFHLDESGILWCRIPDNRFERSRQINGHWHAPQRRILTPEALEREFSLAGFKRLFATAASGVYSGAYGL